MALHENHVVLDFDRYSQTNESMSSATNNRQVNSHFEIDLTHAVSLNSIFVTGASKTLDIDRHTVSSTNSSSNATTTNEHIDLNVCPICCDNILLNNIRQMPCCSIKVCSSCLLTHMITNIRNGKAQIECPSCSQEINSSTILYNSEIPVNIRERYQEILAQELANKQNALIKLCPHCNFITILDENHPIVNRKKFRRPSMEWLRCEQCTKEWCWQCYAPAHPDETCRQYKKSQSQLDRWAKIRRSDNQQRNAQRCPKCSIYIEKIDGCDHMLCVKCNSKFCYRCGSRMRVPLYIGHDAKYSVFGCKYKLYPNRPVLRWLIRGSVFAGVVILTPVVLAAALAVVAVAIPTVLVVGSFALPVFACIQCKKRF